MEEPQVSFSKEQLTVDGVSRQLEHPILDAFAVGQKIIVLYDPDIHREKFGQFRNLEAFSLDGQKLWTAELPTNESGDSYYRAYFRDGLMADSWKSFACKLDEATGKIQNRAFYK
jgi:hypothetical protein